MKRSARIGSELNSFRIELLSCIVLDKTRSRTLLNPIGVKFA